MSGVLEGRRAVVTGAGGGIGAATLKLLSIEGASVLGLDVDETALDEASHGLERVESSVVDLRGEDAIRSLLSFEPDVLVNAAGVLLRAEVLDHTMEEWRATMDINLKATFRLSREFARRHVEGSTGAAIVNVSSIEAFTAAPRHVAYTASKTGVAMLTKAFALELAEYGIRVNAIAPGVTATGMNELLRRDPEQSARLRDQIPMGRFGHPDEQAQAIAFLASDAASYVTGAVLPSDGGWLAQ